MAAARRRPCGPGGAGPRRPLGRLDADARRLPHSDVESSRLRPVSQHHRADSGGCLRHSLTSVPDVTVAMSAGSYHDEFGLALPITPAPAVAPSRGAAPPPAPAARGTPSA